MSLTWNEACCKRLWFLTVVPVFFYLPLQPIVELSTKLGIPNSCPMSPWVLDPRM